MEVMFFVEPIPGGDHNVTLDPLRPRGFAMRQLTAGDPVRPIRKILKRRAAELFDSIPKHQFGRLSRLDAAKPSLFRSGELAERVRNVLRESARGSLPQLVAADATPV